ncbi:hypothetical protein [Streptomyces sp. NPDC024089]|uniref:hypothetical protein n=1 Tax=Streptomyces sp. NPDC024089 TaxID=3154328 RepID=UPI0033C13DD9
METVTSPWEPRERVEYVQELVGKGDSAVLSHALLFPKDCWDDGFGVTAVLRGLPLTDRRDLARSFAEYVITTRAGAGSRKRGLVLLAAVSHGFAESSWCDAWESLLRDKASRLWACGTEDDLWTCGHALLDAGRRLDGEVVALLRRSALEGSWPQECVEPVLSRIRGPVLNPGDGWADRVLAELPALGKPWHALVAHTLRAPTGRSSRTWDRRALARRVQPARSRGPRLAALSSPTSPRLDPRPRSSGRAPAPEKCADRHGRSLPGPVPARPGQVRAATPVHTCAAQGDAPADM